MSESDDASSVTSGASGAPSVTQSMRDNEAPADGSAEQPDGMENSHDIASAVFGVVYTISKEKQGQSYRFAAAHMVLDFLQLFLLIFAPAFGWHINEKLWLWKYISYLKFMNPIISRGYHFMVIVLWAIIAILMIGSVLFIWIGWCFKNDRFPILWPIKVLRVILNIFFNVFYIATLSIFLMPLQCNYLSQDKAMRFHLEHFHTECFAMPHAIHAGAALLATVVFVFIAVVMSMADLDLNLTSQAPLAAASSSVAFNAIGLKTLMALSSALLDGRLKIQAIVITLAAWLLLWNYFQWAPHYNKWVNHIRSGLYGALSWAGLLLLFLVFSKKQADPKFQKAMSIALLSGLGPAFLLVFGASYLRFERVYRAGIKAFRDYNPANLRPKLKDVVKFSVAWQVELLARCCRTWVDEETLDQEAVELAELILKAGMARLSNNAGMTIFYSTFLIEIQASYQAALSQLQLAKKMSPSICEKFVIFVREQQHRQRAQTNRGGESAVDLQGYIEYQRQYRAIVRIHKSSLYATRYFWRQLLNHNISFSTLTKAFSNIERNQKLAEKAYRLVLERYPSSPKLLRTYARFLEDCKNDPWGAARCYSEAENIEEEAEIEQDQAAFNAGEGEEGDNPLGQIDEKSRAIILINATGIIQMANKLALKTFGYKKGELEGKNVSMLMPNPFSQRHNSYLRNYVTTGQAKILDSVRDVVGINKDRYVFPLRLAVTKASGSGNDSMFMGVLTASEEATQVARCVLIPNGTVLCVGDNFTDWFAMGHKDVVGKPFASLAAEQDQVAELVNLANNCSQDQLKEGRAQLEGVQIMHKYLDPIKCNIQCSLGGTDSQRLFMMQITRAAAGLEGSQNFLATDNKGQITFATTGVAKLLGYASFRDLIKIGNISGLMELPFSHMHTKWLAEMPSIVPAASCRNSATVVAVGANGNSIPVKMSIQTRESEGHLTFTMTMIKIGSWEEALDCRRVVVTVDVEGNVTEASNVPSALFGFTAAQIEGAELSTFVQTIHDIIAAEGGSMDDLLHSLLAKDVTAQGISWRVGVRLAAADNAAATWHHAPSAVKAAVMQLEPTRDGDSVRLSLHQADLLTGVVEVDREGRICKAGCCALHQPGLLFGCASSAMVGQPLSKYINLGGVDAAEALLQAAESQGKKSLKNAGGANFSVKLGQLKKFQGYHADGEPLHLTVQAVAKDATCRRIVVKINLIYPSKGSAAALKRSITEAAQSQAHQGSFSTRSASPAPAHKPAARQTTGLRFEAAASEDANEDADEDGDKANALPFQVPTTKRMEAFLDQQQLTASQKVLSSWPDWGDPNAAPPDAPPPPPREDDAASQMSASESHISDPTSQAGGKEQTTDYRKGKRFKKLTRLLAGRRTQAAVTTFRKSTYLLLASLLLTHLVSFIIFSKYINAVHQFGFEMDAAGRATDIIHRIALDGIILRELHEGRAAAGIYDTSDIQLYSNLMRERINEFEINHHGVYLGFTTLRQLQNTKNSPLKDMWETPNLVAQTLVDITPPHLENKTMDLWELGNAYLMSSREVMSNHERMANSSTFLANTTTDMQYNRHWQFVVTNGPGALFEAYKVLVDALASRAINQVAQVNSINMVLLAVEGVVLCTVSIIIMWLLVRHVINMRYRLFSTFLIVPAGFLRVLASKQVHIDEDDINDSDSDNEEAQAGNQEANVLSRKGGASTTAAGNEPQALFLQLDRKVVPSSEENARQSPLKLVKRAVLAFIRYLKGDIGLSSRRKLKRDSADTSRLLAPFCIWMALVLTVYAVSYSQLAKSSPGIIDNAVADNVAFRIDRVLFYAIQFCSRSAAENKEAVRPMVEQTATELAKAYNTLMYGSVKGDTSDTKFNTPGTTFLKGAPVSYFFNSQGRCWRSDPSTCFNSSSEYYEISHNGLDAMINRLVEEGQLLAQDRTVDVNMSSSRLRYIWQVANYDLHPGIQDASAQYTASVLATFVSALNMHVGLFVVSWMLALAFVVLLMKPFLRRVDVEGRRMAELLSQLPADMDVEALVAQALGSNKDADNSANNNKSDPEGAAVGKPAAGPTTGKSWEMAQGPQVGMDDTTGGRARRTSFSIPAEK